MGIILLVTEGVIRLREVPWPRRETESGKNKKPVIQTVY